MTWLTPHLAGSMPQVAKCFSYVIILDLLMIVGAMVAAFWLGFAHLRKGFEETRRLDPMILRNFRKAQGYLTYARRLLIVFAITVLGIWITLSLTRPLQAEWNEVFLVVVYGGVLMPAYLVVTMLRRAFEIAADRFESPSLSGST
jgi:hypothetical protein